MSSVLSTDSTLGGKSGVVVVEDRTSSGTSNFYYAYEANNNVSLAPGIDSLGNAWWITIPVATGSPIVTSSVDSANILGIVLVIRATNTYTREGEEHIVVNGQTVATVKIRLNLRMVTSVAGTQAGDVSSDSFLYFAPSLGFIARVASRSRPDGLGGWINGDYQTLIDYNLM